MTPIGTISILLVSRSERLRARQQAAVAQLGLYALGGADLTDLIDEATRRLAETLDVEYCKVLE